MPPQGGRKHPHQEYLQVNTKNILFICGGAFVDLDAIIKARTGVKMIGFDMQESNKEFKGKNEEPKKLGKQEIRDNILKQVIPEDLMKYGLIPEFVGRLPIIATLEEADIQTLKRIFVEPKNSILKQYIKMFEIEDVKLLFTDSALEMIAQLAVQREAGARGIRSVIEDTMMNLMFMIPSRENISEVVITEGVISKNEPPILILKQDVKAA